MDAGHPPLTDAGKHRSDAIAVLLRAERPERLYVVPDAAPEDAFPALRCAVVAGPRGLLYGHFILCSAKRRADDGGSRADLWLRTVILLPVTSLVCTSSLAEDCSPWFCPPLPPVPICIIWPAGRGSSREGWSRLHRSATLASAGGCKPAAGIASAYLVTEPTTSDRSGNTSWYWPSRNWLCFF